MGRSEFVNGAAADWIDPMAEEAICFKRKRTPPSLEPMLSDETRNKEPEIAALDKENPQSNGLIQEHDISPSKLLKVTPTKSPQKVVSPSNGFIQEHGSSHPKSSTVTPTNLSKGAEKTRPSYNIQLKVDSSSPTARMQLDDICTRNNWNSPSYLLCRAEESDHKKMFKFKVTVAVDDITETIIEGFGDPKPQLIAAQEHAAESALWFLKLFGYSSDL